MFASIAKDGKGTMGWCHSFKLHLLCNDSGDSITFCLTVANDDDRDGRVRGVFATHFYGKVFADRGYNKPDIVYPRHRSLHNFIMNIYTTLTTYCSSTASPKRGL